MKNKVLPKIGQRGFSLVELLVVIAVIAIIAAIAIPNIANITNQAGIAKDQRNAQNIASVAAAAVAAGTGADLRNATAANIELLVDGVTATNGGQVLSFGISSLSDPEVVGALRHLSNNDTPGGAMLYTPSNATVGGAEPSPTP